MKRYGIVMFVVLLVIAGCGGVETPVLTSMPEAVTGFSSYGANPVLSGGEPEAWDSSATFNGRVIVVDGAYHMFYTGSADAMLEEVALGYAVSEDGLAFTRGASNPILAGDSTGFDAQRVSAGVPVFEDGMWILYYSAGTLGPGQAIGRATAPDPIGPWNRRSQYVLVVGWDYEWDSLFISPDSVVRTQDGYLMYYSALADTPGSPSMIGVASSTDGVNWGKYNDRDTSDHPFADSDPVLLPGDEGSWDSEGVWGASVFDVGDGWGMFYSGISRGVAQIGYATSSDGVHWTRHEDNPILSIDLDPLAAAQEPYILETPSVVVDGATYLVYYDYGAGGPGIGLAVGTVAQPGE